MNLNTILLLFCCARLSFVPFPLFLLYFGFNKYLFNHPILSPLLAYFDFSNFPSNVPFWFQDPIRIPCCRWSTSGTNECGPSRLLQDSQYTSQAIFRVSYHFTHKDPKQQTFIASLCVTVMNFISTYVKTPKLHYYFSFH